MEVENSEKSIMDDVTEEIRPDLAPRNQLN